MAKILAPHGVQGWVKLASFTEQSDTIFGLAPLYLADGRVLSLQLMGQGRHKTHNVWLVRLYLENPSAAKPGQNPGQNPGQKSGQKPGQNPGQKSSPPLNRQQIDELIGCEIFVARDALPPPDDEDDFYHADLIGCAVMDGQGGEIGTVTAIHDFGAGTMLVVQSNDGIEEFFPFTRESVPKVDIAARLVVVNSNI